MFITESRSPSRASPCCCSVDIPRSDVDDLIAAECWLVVTGVLPQATVHWLSQAPPCDRIRAVGGETRRWSQKAMQAVIDQLKAKRLSLQYWSAPRAQG